MKTSASRLYYAFDGCCIRSHGVKSSEIINERREKKTLVFEWIDWIGTVLTSENVELMHNPEIPIRPIHVRREVQKITIHSNRNDWNVIKLVEHTSPRT